MKSAFDTALGRAPMHVLTAIWLAITAVTALVLSFAGQLAHDPLQLTLSVTVLVAVAVAVNATLGGIFRRPAHHLSAVITGLILFFLFWPSSDPAGLAVLALVAVIAVLSKYVIAVRGRHLFNPAAVGAFVIGFTGLTASVWWVATPWLAVPVAIGGFLVLYRTATLPVGALFVAVSLLLIAARLVVGGADAASAVGVALSSYPVLFFAGFMLSEPLTLPPRRYQQLAVAAVAAVLFSLPFSLGPLYSTPELALLVANAVAAVWVGFSGLRLIYRGKRQVARTAYEFEFDTKRPLRLQPGQYVELSLPHSGSDAKGSRRVFSVITRPGESGRARHVAVGVRIGDPSSSFKRTLAQLEPGTEIRATRAGGDFVAPTSSRPRLLVAGGMGITPFLSELRETGTGMRGAVDTVLLFLVSSLDDAPYLAEVLATEVPTVLIIADGRFTATDVPTHVTAIAGERVTNAALVHVPELSRRDVRVAGSPSFVALTRRSLREAGVRRVRVDSFAGY